LVICRVQFMEVGGVRKWKKVGTCWSRVLEYYCYWCLIWVPSVFYRQLIALIQCTWHLLQRELYGPRRKLHSNWHLLRLDLMPSMLTEWVMIRTPVTGWVLVWWLLERLLRIEMLHWKVAFISTV
jgi:hypothetical protein